MKRCMSFLTAIAILIALFSFTFTGTASAHPANSGNISYTVVTPPSSTCPDNGSLDMQLQYTGPGNYTFCFTGTGTVDDTTFYSIDTIYGGNWSGYVYYSDGSSTQFCDYQTTSASGNPIVEVYISNTRLPGC